MIQAFLKRIDQTTAMLGQLKTFLERPDVEAIVSLRELAGTALALEKCIDSVEVNVNVLEAKQDRYETERRYNGDIAGVGATAKPAATVTPAKRGRPRKAATVGG